MDTPFPLLTIAIEPMAKTDLARLVTVLAALGDESVSLVASSGVDPGQIILGGASERHLDDTISRLRETDGLAFACGAPRVAYRETMTKRIEKDYTHKKQLAGVGQFARVKFVFEPVATATGTRYVCRLVEGVVPSDVLPGVATGIASVAQAGVVAGFPVVGVRATLLDGAFHDADSSAHTFEIAARAAFREALREGACVLLEPIMRVRVTTPEDYSGAVAGDMAARGEVIARDVQGHPGVIVGLAALANLLGYEAQLRALTLGRATHEMRFDHLHPVPSRGGDGPPPAVAAALRA